MTTFILRNRELQVSLIFRLRSLGFWLISLSRIFKTRRSYWGPRCLEIISPKKSLHLFLNSTLNQLCTTFPYSGYYTLHVRPLYFRSPHHDRFRLSDSWTPCEQIQDLRHPIYWMLRLQVLVFFPQNRGLSRLNRKETEKQDISGSW